MVSKYEVEMVQPFIRSHAWELKQFHSSAIDQANISSGNKYNKSCDVFSFGIAVWEMLARKRPIIGKAANIDLAILFATATGR